jgi:hypothetical protein
MATVDDTQLNALVADVEAKQQALSDATDADNSAQAAAAQAAAAAATTATAKTGAHDALAASVDSLVTYLKSLAS